MLTWNRRTGALQSARLGRALASPGGFQRADPHLWLIEIQNGVEACMSFLLVATEQDRILGGKWIRMLYQKINPETHEAPTAE